MILQKEIRLEQMNIDKTELQEAMDGKILPWLPHEAYMRAMTGAMKRENCQAAV